jgi:hypothetical protein
LVILFRRSGFVALKDSYIPWLSNHLTLIVPDEDYSISTLHLIYKLLSSIASIIFASNNKITELRTILQRESQDS